MCFCLSFYLKARRNSRSLFICEIHPVTTEMAAVSKARWMTVLWYSSGYCSFGAPDSGSALDVRLRCRVWRVHGANISLFTPQLERQAEMLYLDQNLRGEVTGRFQGRILHYECTETSHFSPLFNILENEMQRDGWMHLKRKQTQWKRSVSAHWFLFCFTTCCASNLCYDKPTSFRFERRL